MTNKDILIFEKKRKQKYIQKFHFFIIINNNLTLVNKIHHLTNYFDIDFHHQPVNNHFLCVIFLYYICLSCLTLL